MTKSQGPSYTSYQAGRDMWHVGCRVLSQSRPFHWHCSRCRSSTCNSRLYLAGTPTLTQGFQTGEKTDICGESVPFMHSLCPRHSVHINFVTSHCDLAKMFAKSQPCKMSCHIPCDFVKCHEVESRSRLQSCVNLRDYSVQLTCEDTFGKAMVSFIIVSLNLRGGKGFANPSNAKLQTVPTLGWVGLKVSIGYACHPWTPSVFSRYQVSLPVLVNNAYKHPLEISLLFCEHLRGTKWQETTERWGLNYDNKVIIWVWYETDTIKFFIFRISYLVKKEYVDCLGPQIRIPALQCPDRCDAQSDTVYGGTQRAENRLWSVPCATIRTDLRGFQDRFVKLATGCREAAEALRVCTLLPWGIWQVSDAVEFVSKFEYFKSIVPFHSLY
ncbi:hypothetical protein MJG53_013885 [Ovis ammon polii x Ovis aries]|uniref:Uncharacterized protein n=1 Tax=Ovis ammon polii x Ovis aries TaxID=2918886 RepID=A0ACB9UK62_9CETA|nr:hypothetical protein MJG53_013885 [Ovis ammon polii x Ovis aries]